MYYENLIVFFVIVVSILWTRIAYCRHPLCLLLFLWLPDSSLAGCGVNQGRRPWLSLSAGAGFG